MKQWINRFIPIFQVLVLLGSIAFVSLAYEHHTGNDRFMKYFLEKKTAQETNFVKRRLFREYPKLEDLEVLKSPNPNEMHLFQAHDPEQDPIKIARIRKELTCKDCRTLDFLVVLNKEASIQLVKLIDPILITGKAINPNKFLEQFKNKSNLEGIEPIEDAPESSEAITQGVSEALSLIKARG